MATLGVAITLLGIPSNGTVPLQPSQARGGAPCAVGDITNIKAPSVSPSGSFVWATNTKMLTTTTGTWQSDCPITHSYRWIREQDGGQVSSTSSYTTPEAAAKCTTCNPTRSGYTFHSEVMACDQAECSQWVRSSTSAAPYISYPGKAANFNCQSGVYGTTSTSDLTAFWAKRGTVLDALSQTHAKWVRINWLSWVQAQRHADGFSLDPNYYDDAGYLATIKECVRKITSSPYNMKVVLVVQGTPNYANGVYGETINNVPPTDCRTNTATCVSFKSFLYHLLTHTLHPYRGSIALEIWNEPNLDDNWSASDPSRSDDVYYYLLRAAYAEVDAIAPGVTVVMGGAAGDGNPDAEVWIDLLYGDCGSLHYPLGATSCTTHPWDVVALHPYPPYAGNCPTAATTLSRVGNAVLKSMETHSPSDASKPIWLTEGSWPAGDDYDGKAYGDSVVCTQTGQATQLQNAYTYRALPTNAKKLFWWISDRKILDGHQANGKTGCAAWASQGASWACGVELLDATLSYSGATRSLYNAFSEIPAP